MRSGGALSLIFDALEIISLDHTSMQALGDPGKSFNLQLPSLTTAHMAREPDFGYWLSAEKMFFDWINSEFFPSTVKEIFLEMNQFHTDGQTIDLGQLKVEWQTIRSEVLALCKKKGLEVKILREGEQREFDRRTQRARSSFS